MYLYQRIRDLREDADLTQTQIAQLLKTSQTVYSRYERNERTLPTEKEVRILLQEIRLLQERFAQYDIDKVNKIALTRKK